MTSLLALRVIAGALEEAQREAVVAVERQRQAGMYGQGRTRFGSTEHAELASAMRNLRAEHFVRVLEREGYTVVAL